MAFHAEQFPVFELPLDKFAHSLRLQSQRVTTKIDAV
jgi:hypothetical protein